MKPWKSWNFLLPALVGVGLSLVLLVSVRQRYVLYVRADLVLLVFSLGCVVSLVWWSIIRLVQGRKEDQVRIASRARDDRLRLLRRLDHELKNPLTAIRAGLANLAETPPEEARSEALLSVEAQTLRLSRLSTNLRKLAELEDRLIERRVFQPEALLQEAFLMAQELPGADQRELLLTKRQESQSLPDITGDQDLILLAVHNLLENAIKFSLPGDRIELGADPAGDQVVIYVMDSGPGIVQEEQPHVWEELYRGRTGRGIPGSGLGLSLVKVIMERHHGEATLTSRPGRTIFRLIIPANRETRVTEP